MGPRKSGKSWNFIVSGIFQDWKVLEKGFWSWKGLEIVKLMTSKKIINVWQTVRRINIEILGVKGIKCEF